jgi:hypothetical protein
LELIARFPTLGGARVGVMQLPADRRSRIVSACPMSCYRDFSLATIDAAERVAHVRTSASLSAGSAGGWHVSQRQPQALSCSRHQR